MSWVALILCLSTGWFLSNALSHAAWTGPRWMTILGEASLAALFGPGLASALFFFMLLAGVGTAPAVLTMLAGVTVLSAGLWWRFREDCPPSATARRFPWMGALVAASIAGLLILVLDFQVSRANPAGEWDASGIWNLRARYLAGGSDTWKYALSPDTGGPLAGASHSNYPLFLSSFVALQWVAAGRFDAATPATVSVLFSLSILLLLSASVARHASVVPGLLAWLVLLGSDVFISQTSAQYSDLLLGLAFLASLVLLDRVDRSGPSLPLLLAAGLAIGLAPWIKNEGWPFFCAALGIAAWRFRGRAIFWIMLGAMPGLLATIALKIVSQGREATIPATIVEVLTKVSDASRWWKILVGFGAAVLGTGPLWAHPLLLMAALAITVRFVPTSGRRAPGWLWIPIAATLAAEYGLYLVTTADLDWQISTSVNRLVAQVWPSLLWLMFLMLRAPEDYFAAVELPVKPV